MKLQVGLDIGSTTAKMVALIDDHQLVFKSYLRHFSEIKKTLIRLLQSLFKEFPTADLHAGSSKVNPINRIK